jgi:hypothetical protein
MSDERNPQGAGAPPKTHEIDVTHSTEFHFTLDEEKIQAIRGCIERGALRITVVGANIAAGGRFQAAYLYD